MIVEPRTIWGKSLTRLDEEEKSAQFFIIRTPGEIRESIDPVGTEPGAVGFTCEAVGPKSARFKTVHVYVPPEQVLALLKLCRRAAAAQREQAMPGG